jgi:hypothetical protein
MRNEEPAYWTDRCSLCGSVEISYTQDITVSNEVWSPIDCSRCKRRTYEVWRGFNLVRIIKPPDAIRSRLGVW